MRDAHITFPVFVHVRDIASFGWAQGFGADTTSHWRRLDADFDFLSIGNV